MHTKDIKVDDIDNDGQAEIVIIAKNNSDDVPSGISLYVYEDKGTKWEQTKKINLGKKALFWEVQKGIWGMDGNGVRNLYYPDTRLVSHQTWLKELGETSPKEADFVHDLNGDGELEFLINSGGKISVWSQSGESWGVLPVPKIGSIREYSKTGGTALEIAQRSAPVVVQDVNGDGVQDIVFLKSTKAEVNYSSNWMLGTSKQTIDLPINVEPQYGSHPKRELRWLEFTDINGDQKIDLIWQYWLTGETRFGASSEIGWALGNGSGFDEAQSFTQEQAIVNVRLEDLESDDDLDLMLIGTDLGLGSLATALVSQSASADLQISSFDAGKFQSNPKEVYSFSLPIKMQDVLDYSEKLDLNRDGKKDLMVVLIDQYIELHRVGDGFEEARREKLSIKGGKFHIGCLECKEPTVVIWQKGTVQAQIFHVKPD